MSTQRQNRSQPIDGVLLLNKPAGLTSNQALQRVKRLLGAKKAGHTGSLDPAATGMLPLCFGEATKVCAFLLDADKTYRVTAKLGVATDTGDADGKPIRTAEVPQMSRDDWALILDGFLGESEQIPPMYSALKKDGKRLYELARKGEVVERPPRPIRIDEIELLEAAGKRLVFRVRCSKGTYVRSLVEDIAARADTVAHTASLHRETVDPFDAGEMLDLAGAEALVETNPEGLRDQLLPPDRALASIPAVSLTAEAAARFLNGQSVEGGDERSIGITRVYGPDGPADFLGVGELSIGGGLAPKRIFGRGSKT